MPILGITVWRVAYCNVNEKNVLLPSLLVLEKHGYIFSTVDDNCFKLNSKYFIKGESGIPGRPGRQGPAGPKGVFDPDLAEPGRPGSIGPQGPDGN